MDKPAVFINWGAVKLPVIVLPDFNTVVLKSAAIVISVGVLFTIILEDAKMPFKVYMGLVEVANILSPVETLDRDNEERGDEFVMVISVVFEDIERPDPTDKPLVVKLGFVPRPNILSPNPIFDISIRVDGKLFVIPTVFDVLEREMPVPAVIDFK